MQIQRILPVNKVLLMAVSLGLFMVVRVAMAEWLPMADDDLARIQGKEGATFLLEGPALLASAGTHPFFDADYESMGIDDVSGGDPLHNREANVANSINLYFDSTADGNTTLDFWIGFERMTTNPRAKKVDGTSTPDQGQPMLVMEFDLDVATKQVERLYRANGNVRDENSKLSFMVLKVDGYKDDGITERWMEFGEGDRHNPFTTGAAYADPETGAACAGKLADDDCVFRGLGIRNIDSFTQECFGANSAACNGTFITEMNFWGKGHAQGQVLVYGRGS